MSHLGLIEGDMARIKCVDPSTGKSSGGVPAYRMPWVYGKVRGVCGGGDGEEHVILKIPIGYYFARTDKERVEKVSHGFSEN